MTKTCNIKLKRDYLRLAISTLAIILVGSIPLFFVMFDWLECTVAAPISAFLITAGLPIFMGNRFVQYDNGQKSKIFFTDQSLIIANIETMNAEKVVIRNNLIKIQFEKMVPRGSALFPLSSLKTRFYFCFEFLNEDDVELLIKWCNDCNISYLKKNS